MIRYELLRMLRNRKWKYLIPAALLAYIYISGVSSLTVTEGSIYQDQQIQAAACLVSFLFLSICLSDCMGRRTTAFLAGAPGFSPYLP